MRKDLNITANMRLCPHLCVLLYVNYAKPEVDILIAYKIAIHLDFPVLT